MFGRILNIQGGKEAANSNFLNLFFIKIVYWLNKKILDVKTMQKICSFLIVSFYKRFFKISWTIK